MGAAWFLARGEPRRRALMWALLTLSIGLLGGTALATAAGARRTSSAFDRFVKWSHGDDLSVLGFGAPPGALDRVAALPDVADSLRASLVPFQPHGSDGPFDFDTALIVSPDSRYLDGTFVRPIMVEGRLPDLAQADEVVVNESMAQRLGLHAGDLFSLDVLTAAQIATSAGGEPIGAPEGPTIPVRIAGIVRLPGDLVETAAQGLVSGSGAFYDRWASQIPLDIGVLAVKLRSASQTESFVAAAVAIVEGADVQHFDPRVANDAITVQAIGLSAFSAIVGIAALVALGQALSRVTALADTDHAAYSATGMTRGQRVAAAALPGVIAAAVGSLLAAAVAFAASPLFPRGLAERAEPRPGLHADVVVLVLGGIFTFVALGAWLLAAGRIRTSAPNAASHRAPVSARIAEIGSLGVSPSTGLRFALQRGRGARATPNASSVAAAVVGLTGVIAVVVFGGSLDHLLHTPSLVGTSWDTQIGTVPASTLEEVEAALDTPAFSGIATIRSAQVVVGDKAMEGYGIDARRGSGFVAVLAGREPRAPDEAAFGTTTLARLDLGIGDTVDISVTDGQPHRVRVVGRVTLPVLNTDVDRLAEGVIMTRPGIDAILGPTAEPSLALVLRFGDATRAQRNLDAIAQRYGRDTFPAPAEPREVANMRPVRGVLTAIGLLTGLLAVVSIAHLLIVSVRRRRRELGVLRALGFSPSQIRAAVHWQALTLGMIAVGFGIPAGVIAGRAAWSSAAHRLGVQVIVTVPVSAVVVVSAAFMLTAVLLSIGPGRRAASLRAAAILRAE